ncbi:MAG: hypothetical protein SFY69_07565 [Planctomycetota bacterium]|nr:hypothetical protein [Planctomycetota bacterium]
MKSLIGVGVMALLAGVIGCSQQRTGDRGYPYDGTVRGPGEPTRTHAPRGPESTTAAQPARTTEVARTTPVASSGSGVYYPSGVQNNAALFLDRSYPSEVIAGAPFEYLIKVTNVSPSTLEDVTVVESMPSGFTVASTTPQGASADGGRAWAFDLGRMTPGETKTIRVNGAAGNVGTVQSCATLSYTIPACMTIPVVKPSLALTKTVPAEVMMCDPIPVKLVVTNTGTGVARNVKVTDPLPVGLTTADGRSSVEFDAGTLNAGQSREFTFNAKATRKGSFQNTGRAVAEGNLTANSNQTTTVVRQPELAIKAECPEAILIGRQATFRFTVSNKGDGNCNATVVTAPLPQGATFVSADNGGTLQGSNVVWNLATLNANASRTLNMTVSAGGAGTMTASATATCTCANAVTDSCTTGVRGTPDMATLLDDSEGVVTVGTNQAYRYEVTNQGQVDLTNVQVSIVLPEGMEFVSSTLGQPQRAGTKFTWRIADRIPRGEKRAGTITVRTTRDGEFLVISETTCAELRLPVRDDEITVFIPAPGQPRAPQGENQPR